MDDFYAHSNQGNFDKSSWHRLEDHLQQTAELAASFAQPFRSECWARLAGLWHDLGKCSAEFQQRLLAAGGENAHIEYPGRVDHSTAGAQHAASTLGDAGKALAYAIAGHHGGLPDGLSSDSCLAKRLTKTIPDWSDCPQELLDAEVPTLPFALTADLAGMRLSMFIRMIYSCLVDADFLDTERFMQSERAAERGQYRSLRELAPVFFERLKKLQSGAVDSDVNAKREEVLAQCLAASSKPMGLFSLTVPTGGGKTLSSMAFALQHAANHQLRRIIYVIPFTSIIEQNARVFREAMGDDVVVEHHSNFEPLAEDRRSRLAAENWDAPIIVTTNVQFFESLFANRSSRCRKLHNIAESVVILDEVQTLPPNYLLPCLAAIDELRAQYRVSIVLCSATQPAVQVRPDFPKGLQGVTEIVADPQELAAGLRRTKVEVVGELSEAVIAGMVGENHQVLCIVNTRKQARELFKQVTDRDGLFHLSALMCPVHRTQVLAAVRDRLAAGKRCRVISTQLIEAGVDIDFPVVFRAMAGIDSIVQAAGRCNREGKLAFGRVVVFTPESGIPPGDFRHAAQAAESAIRRHPDGILSLAAIEEYFMNYYWGKGDELDAKGVLPSLQEGLSALDFPFRTIAEQFHFIEQVMKPVVIPFDSSARKLIQAMDFVDNPASLSRRLQKYTVSIYPNQWSRLQSAGSVVVKADLYPVLVDESLYSRELGLSTGDPVQRDPEQLYI